MKLVFSERAWRDYLFWQDGDRRNLAKLNSLIKDALRSPFAGLGKPEALAGEFSGWWSRRIDHEHRLVYQVVDDSLIIGQCRYHYER